MARVKVEPRLAAFLDMIAWSEGTYGKGDDGYNVLFGGSTFDGYYDHPRKIITVGKLHSSAAGRYQLLERYYDIYSKRMRLINGFTPENQDLIAIQQIREELALRPIRNGDIPLAIRLCSNIWASLPGSPYGQHTHDMNKLVDVWVKFGGKVRS